MGTVDEKTLDSDRETVDLILAGKLVTVREAAALTGISVWGVYDRMKRGKVRVWGEPRQQRVCLDDLLPKVQHKTRPGRPVRKVRDSRRHWWQAIGD